MVRRYKADREFKTEQIQGFDNIYTPGDIGFLEDL